MQTYIDHLIELCKERPFSKEEIQSYIAGNNLDSEAVTRAALALCDYGSFSVRDYHCRYERDPKPEELITYNWEALFHILIDNGLDVNLVICDDGHNSGNILDAIQHFDDGNLNARIARNILQRQGMPTVLIDGETVFSEVDSCLMTDIGMGLYPKKWMLDNAFRFWLVLVGFGGVLMDGRSPVMMCAGYQAEIFQDFEKYDYRITYNEKDFDMEIFEKETGTVVATV